MHGVGSEPRNFASDQWVDLSELATCQSDNDIAVTQDQSCMQDVTPGSVEEDRTDKDTRVEITEQPYRSRDPLPYLGTEETSASIKH